MTLSNVWIIPFCAFAFNIAAFVVSYIIAVHNDHVKALWPYISDSGALPPESCIFGQLLNMGALFLAITFYLRHRQIVEFYWHRFKQTGHWRLVSNTLLWMGYISAFGVSIIANFQENHVIFVHYFGALMTFGTGLVYSWAQTILSYNMNPKMARPIVSHCRLILCIFSTAFFVNMIIFGSIYGKQPEHHIEKNSSCYYLYKWTGEEPNYREHMVGTVSEWCLAICFQLYILSFALELRHAYCHAPKLKLISFFDSNSEIDATTTYIQQTSIKFKSQTNGIAPDILPVKVMNGKVELINQTAQNTNESNNNLMMNGNAKILEESHLSNGDKLPAKNGFSEISLATAEEINIHNSSKTKAM